MEDADCSADGVPVRLRASQEKTDAAVRGQLIVTEEKGRSVVRGHQNVEISVTIEVGVRQTTADLWLVESSACLGSHIAEGPISLVEKKLWRLGVTDIASDVPYRFIDMTVRDHQVKCAVELGIEKHAPESQSVLRRKPDYPRQRHSLTNTRA